MRFFEDIFNKDYELSLGVKFQCCNCYSKNVKFDTENTAWTESNDLVVIPMYCCTCNCVFSLTLNNSSHENNLLDKSGFWG